MILILTTMVGLMFFVSNTLERYYLSDLENDLIAHARQISLSIPLISDNLDTNILNELANEWSTIYNARITIIDNGGVVVGESHEDFSNMENHINRPEIQDAMENPYGSSVRFSSTMGYEMMYVAVPIVQNGSREGFVRVALPITQIKGSIRSIQQGLYVGTIIALFIAFLMAVIIADTTTRPIRNLVDEAVFLTKNLGLDESIDKRIRNVKKGEIEQLTAIINSSISRINRQMERVQNESIKMNEVLDFMTDGVIIADAQGRIQLINPAAKKMFDIPSQGAIGHSIAEVLRHHQLIELWQRCQESDQYQSISMEIGLERSYLNGIATPLGKGVPGGILLLFQDLTRVKQLEIVRRDFISNISHELRTPLASLKALIETLVEGALDDPPAARKFLQHIDVEIDSLIQIVEELLELSRIESGKVPLQLEPIPPKIIIDSAVERLNVQAERASLEINIDCPMELPEILADRGRIERVVVNLLHNAIKFTPSGGKIDISAEGVREYEEQFVLFMIKDNGIGISDAELPRIFERFYKSDRARSSGGTGLGLAIAQHIVLIHGGRIWVESVEGEGSSFYFTIPAADNT